MKEAGMKARRNRGKEEGRKKEMNERRKVTMMHTLFFFS